MPQQHDIVLNLEAKRFEQGIERAHDLIVALDDAVRQLQRTIRSTFENIDLRGLTSQINEVNRAINSVGRGNIAPTAGLTKLNTELNKTADAAKNVSDQIKTISVSTSTAATQATAQLRPVFRNLVQISDEAKARLHTGLETTLENSLKRLNSQAQSNKAFKDLPKTIGDIGESAKQTSVFVDTLTRGLGIGLAHSVGAITAGANVFRSLVHEIPRNLAISFFNLGFKKVADEIKGVGQAAGEGGERVQNLGGQVRTLSDTLDQAAASAGGFGGGFIDVLNSIDFAALKFYGTLLLLGIILDKIGDKILEFTKGLAQVAGEANLSFLRLDAVIKNANETLDANLGNINQWRNSIRELAIASGKSQKDLADFAVAFTQAGAAAGLTGDQLQELLRIASFTQDLFRNSTEQLSNFRQALAGNVRFLQTNINIGATFSETQEIVTNQLIRQGKSLEEAQKAVNEMSRAQVVLLALQERSEPVIKTAIETTGNYALELRKLQGAIENLKISFGSTVQGPFAAFTRALREGVNLLNNLPTPIVNFIGNLTLLSGVILSVGGTILKWVGIIGLVRVAINVLNANIEKTLPLIGVSFSQIFARAQTFLTGTAVSAGTLSGVLSALTGVITGLLLKAGLFIAAFTLLVAVIQKLEERFQISSTVLQFFEDVIDSINPKIKEFVSSLQLGMRTAEAFNAVISGIAAILTGLATVFLLISTAIQASLSNLLNGIAEFQSIFPGTTQSVERLRNAAQRLRDGSNEAANMALKAAQATKELGLEAFNSALIALGLAEAVDKTTESIENLKKAADKPFKFNEEQEKIVKKFLDTAVRQFRDAQIDFIRATQGDAAAEAARLQDQFSDLVNELEAAGKLDKNSQAFKELEQQIFGASEAAQRLRNQLEGFKDQQSVFKTLLGQVQTLKKNLQEQALALRDQLKLQNEFNLNVGLSDFSEEALAAAKRQNEISKETLEIERKIEAVRKQLSEPQKVGDKLVTLNERDRRRLESQLDELTKEREIKVKAVLDLQSAKELQDRLQATARLIQDAQRGTVTELLNINNQISLLDTFNDNISKGLDFANRQVSLRQKELALNEVITNLEIQKSKATGEERVALESVIQGLIRNRQLILDRLAGTVSTKEAEKELNEALQKNKESLEDQLKLIREREKLTEEGLLQGLNTTQERVDAITAQLEFLIQQRIRLQRLERQSPNLLPPDSLRKVNEQIAKIKEALKAANFVNDIRELLQVIPDAIADALNDGIRGVIQGTQTIEDLFRNMAQNIFLSLSRIFANRAIKQITDGLDKIAKDIAQSPLGRKIAELLGVNLDALFEVEGTPEEKLESAVTLNTSATDRNTSALDRLTNALGGSGGFADFFKPIQETDITTGIPEAFQDRAGPGTSPVDDLDREFGEILRSGTDQVTQEADSLFGGFFDKIGDFLNNGLDSIIDLAGSGFDSLFSSLGSLLSTGLESLLSGIGNIFSGGGGSFLSSIFGSIGGFFGFAKGGRIPGRSSKEDDQLISAASGEYVTNSEAVNFYGQELFDALNNMSLPKDFFEGLTSAPSLISNMSGSTPVQKQIIPQPVQQQSQPVNVTVIEKSPKLDPAKLGMQEDDVVQVYVNGVRKDRLIRKVMREDLATSRV